VPLVIVGSLLLAFALFLVLRRPAADAPEEDHWAAISVSDSEDINIDGNELHGSGRLLDAKRVKGLRARRNREFR